MNIRIVREVVDKMITKLHVLVILSEYRWCCPAENVFVDNRYGHHFIKIGEPDLEHQTMKVQEWPNYSRQQAFDLPLREVARIYVL